MRWLLAALLIAASGCLGPADGALFQSDRQDCSINQQSVVAAGADMLLPATVPDDVRDQFGPVARITVQAREGQMLQAVATWTMLSGEVDVLYDGPHSNEASTDRTWSAYGEVSAGEYTLELEGAPVAADVTYTLYLVATGCTPISADES